MTTEELHSVTEKKVVRWTEGLVAFITPEAKKFGWDEKTKIKVFAITDKQGDAIVIRKSKG